MRQGGQSCSQARKVITQNIKRAQHGHQQMAYFTAAAAGQHCYVRRLVPPPIGTGFLGNNVIGLVKRLRVADEPGIKTKRHKIVRLKRKQTHHCIECCGKPVCTPATPCPDRRRHRVNDWRNVARPGQTTAQSFSKAHRKALHIHAQNRSRLFSDDQINKAVHPA